MPHQDSNTYPRRRKNDLPDEFEGTPTFEPILTLVRSLPAVEPPRDFSHKLMRRLSEGNSGLIQAVDGQPLSRRLKDAIQRLTRPTSVLEVATCFFLSGFFYLALSVSLYVGLKSLNTAPTATGWIYYQPYIAVLIAMGFITVGVLLSKKNRLAFRFANSIIIFFIIFSIINGMQIQSIPPSPFSFYGVLCFSAGTIILGIFLAVTLNSGGRWASSVTEGTP